MRRIVVPIASLVLLVAGVGCQGDAPGDPTRAATDRTADLPTDKVSLGWLAEAGRYYKEPRDVWPTCREFARRLTEAGHPASANAILKSSVVVLQRLGVRPVGDQGIRNFCKTYESRRVDPYWGDGRHGPATHEEAVDLLVKDRKFANQ